MRNYLLKPLIEKIKNQDMSVFPIVYEEFRKLIALYAAKLNYEDAVGELTLFFIELLYDIKLSKFSNDESLGIKKYIAVALKNKYISLSVKKTEYIMSSNDLYEGCDIYTEDFEDRFFIGNGLKKLSEKQRMIILYKYIYGYADCEIAARLNISRQAVNKLKNRALGVMREDLIDDEALFI